MIETQHPFLQLVEEHSGAIERICRSFCRTDEEREDLRQDIILNLWQGWQHYQPKARSVTWVWRVAMNTAISQRRRQQRQVETESLLAIDYPEDVADHESQEFLNSLIVRLPYPDQQLLHLYLDGWKQAEIAAMLNLSVTNVQTRISRIKQKLGAMNSNHEKY